MSPLIFLLTQNVGYPYPKAAMAKDVSEEEYVIDFCAEQLRHKADDFLAWSPDEQVSYLHPVVEGLVGTPLTAMELALLRDKVAAKLSEGEKPKKKPKAKLKEGGKEGEPGSVYMILDGTWKQLLKETGDRKYAETLFKELKKELAIESKADEHALIDLVLLKVRQRRMLVTMSKKTTTAAQGGAISDAAEKIMKRTLEMEKSFSATRDQRTKAAALKDTDDVYQTVTEARKRALKYMEEHPNTFMQWACVKCGTIHFSGMPHPFFEGCYLWNEPLARLVQAGRITVEEAAEVLGWSPIEHISRLSPQGYIDLFRRRGHRLPKGAIDAGG